jgi:16S rRNA (cytidine1402-2'-O)-methyltransferase
MSGTLYIVATPIGNLDDLTSRARQTLAEADLIAAEDTRHTSRLLSHIGARTPQKALHEHNEQEVVAQLVEELVAGRNVALVSDAGTPLISDPGYRLVAAAHEQGIVVSPVPGPSAVIAALSVSGLPTDRFCFEGFPPAKKSARAEWLSRLAKERRTLVFFESVHRIRASLADMAAVFGDDRRAFIARELTKIHEQCIPGTLAGLSAAIDDGTIAEKGEYVVIVAGAEDVEETALDVDTLISELAAVLPGKQAAAIAARVTGGKRNALYQRMLELKGS